MGGYIALLLPHQNVFNDSLGSTSIFFNSKRLNDSTKQKLLEIQCCLSSETFSDIKKYDEIRSNDIKSLPLDNENEHYHHAKATGNISDNNLGHFKQPLSYTRRCYQKKYNLDNISCIAPDEKNVNYQIEEGTYFPELSSKFGIIEDTLLENVEKVLECKNTFSVLRNISNVIVEDLSCAICQYSESIGGNFKSHKRNVHENAKRLSCDSCKYEVARNKQL